MENTAHSSCPTRMSARRTALNNATDLSLSFREGKAVMRIGSTHQLLPARAPAFGLGNSRSTKDVVCTFSHFRAPSATASRLSKASTSVRVDVAFIFCLELTLGLGSATFLFLKRDVVLRRPGLRIVHGMELVSRAARTARQSSSKLEELFCAVHAFRSVDLSLGSAADEMHFEAID